MSGLLGRPPQVEPDRKDASVVAFDGGDEGAVFDALSAGTARSILAELHRAPSVPSDLADAVDSSLQNVSYHIEKLEAAGLIEVVDQCYSERGREMDVYAPTAGPLVLLPEDGDGEAARAVARAGTEGAGRIAED